MPFRDPEARRAHDRERYRKRTAERRAAGFCPKCGKFPPSLGRSLCEACARKARAAGRARDARLRAAGKPQRNREKARAAERRRYRRQVAERSELGLCIKCGIDRAEDGRRLCAECAEKRREAERRRYYEAKFAGKLYGLSGAPDKPCYPERGFIPSDMPETALPCGFRAHRLGINFDGHYPPSTSISSSLTPQNLPRRISGGALTSRIFSLSAGVARRYISVVLRSA